MTFVAYTQCDECGRKYHSDLTPEGWVNVAGNDYCRECKAMHERAGQAPGATPKEES